MKADYEQVLANLRHYGAKQFTTTASGAQYIKSYELANRFIPSSAHVLDWGTGSGHFSFFLLTRGHMVDAFGIDASECVLRDQLCAEFPESYKLTIEQAAVSQLPYTDTTFDAVVSIGVLEHVRETGGTEAASLAEIHRILKDDGIFLCYHLPNRYSLIELLSRFCKNKYSHRYRFTSQQIRSYAKEAGLEIIELRRYGVLPRLIMRKVPFFDKLVNVINRLDDILSFLFSPICQNYYFVARKRSSERSSSKTL